ncbi:hypothetical protein [Pseudoruegeria sp. SK021]|uniref:hypothetical protein n=1 Tax=Pseudoruegeria sp. SK021 TaxID=1933035 RepID=UPI00143D800F|nr:hypothetical protein [Pseudoruegeria sp. SK021]
MRLLMFLMVVAAVVYGAVSLVRWAGSRGDVMSGTGLQKLSFALLVGLMLYAAVTGGV